MILKTNSYQKFAKHYSTGFLEKSHRRVKQRKKKHGNVKGNLEEEEIKKLIIKSLWHLK